MAGQSPFSALDYKISYRPDSDTRTEVRISATTGSPLQVGDSLTVCDERFFYDLVVQGVLRAGSEWSAVCGVADRRWL